MQQTLVYKEKQKTPDATIMVKELVARRSAKISSNGTLALVTIGSETHALSLSDMVPASAELLLDEKQNVIELQPMQSG